MPVSCTNCGVYRTEWLAELALQQDLPFATPAPKEDKQGDKHWRCTRCRPRHDLGSTRTCREIRDRYGLTQRHWARVLGVDLRTVARWETGSPEPKGLSLELLEAFDQAADANEKVIALVRGHARKKRYLPELLRELLVLAVGGVVRRRRRPPAPDELVLMRVRMSAGERETVTVAAYRSGQSLSDWARGSLVRVAVNTRPSPHLNGRPVIQKVAHV